MSTPIYDALCETMPGPDGYDDEEAARPAQDTEMDGAVDQDGRASGAADQDGHASGSAASNGKVSAGHEGDGATSHNGRVASNATTSSAGR